MSRPTATESLANEYGVDPELLKDLERQFGFDKPVHERLIDMLTGYAVFDFGTSYFQDVPVIDLIVERLPSQFPLVYGLC